MPGLQGITETGGHEGDISEGANLGAFAQHGALGSAGQTQADAGGRIRGHDPEKVFTALGFSHDGFITGARGLAGKQHITQDDLRSAQELGIKIGTNGEAHAMGAVTGPADALKQHAPFFEVGFLFQRGKHSGHMLFPCGVLLRRRRDGRWDIDPGGERLAFFQAEFQHFERLAIFECRDAFSDLTGITTRSDDAGQIDHDRLAPARIGGEGSEDLFFDFGRRTGNGGIHPAQITMSPRKADQRRFGRFTLPETQRDLQSKLRWQTGIKIHAQDLLRDFRSRFEMILIRSAEGEYLLIDIRALP